MSRRLKDGFLASPVLTSILASAVLFSVLLLIPKLGAVRLTGIQTGYEPPQPIAFSHRLHAGEMQVSCLYCHSGAERSRHAGVPAANVCMNCHRFVTAPLGAIRAEEEAAQKEGRKPSPVISPELAKLYDSLALDPQMKRDPNRLPRPIAWTKVHNLPDFVYFDHRPHVGAGVACQKCHGPVETMERVRQTEDLTMGWCVNCHREVNAAGLPAAATASAAMTPPHPDRKLYASVDCATCHY